MCSISKDWKPVSSFVRVICLLVTLSGCSATRYAEKAGEVVEVPEEIGAMESFGADTWCSDFGHQGLDEMVKQVWSDNVELKAAWARLKQARAIVKVEYSPLFPTLAANAGVNYTNRQFIDGVAAGDPASGAQTSWELSAAAAYEVDIFGRHRHRAKAASIEAGAVEASARSLAITLTSQVAEAWFDVIAHRQRVALLEAQLGLSEDILQLTMERLRRGLVTALDAAQQEQNIESIRGQLAAVKGFLSTSRHRLAVLVGEPPSDQKFVDDETLPDIRPLPEAGVPANLLERRPDLRAAYLLLEAADERTAAAVADRLPQLRLSAAIGFQADQLSNLFTQLFYSAGAGLFQPLFEGRRLKAEVERGEAIAEEQLYNYADTLLVALREVRDAIALESNNRDRIDSLERERRVAQTVVDLARFRYRAGAANYLRVLTGLRDLQEVERTLIEAHRQQISYRISLCRALGGS